MTISKGSVVSAAGAFVTLVLFFVSPWVTRSVGPFDLGSGTGLSLAGQGQPFLYGVAIAAVVGLFVILLAGIGWLPNPGGSLLLVLLGVGPLLYLLFVLPALSGSQTFLFFQFGQITWGFWATLVTLALIAAGGVMNLVGVD